MRVICICGDQLYENFSLEIDCHKCGVRWIKDSLDSIGYRIANNKIYNAIAEARSIIKGQNKPKHLINYLNQIEHDELYAQWVVWQ